MDLGSVIGLVLTMLLLVVSMAMGVGIGPYIDVPSIIIVFGGTMGTLLIGFRPEQLKKIGKVFMVAIKPPQIDPKKTVKNIIEYAIKARKEGILSIEDDLQNEEDEFLKKGLSLAVDGVEPDAIKEILENDIDQMSSRHSDNASIFGQIASFAGAMGMIGTLIGLVAMLLNMADPAAIGPAMAVALLTTMYGAIIGNVFGTPIENILTLRDKDEVNLKTIIVKGIMAIQAGDNPRNIETKLFAFLNPTDRESQFDK
jgi:chemotaxis protein MotA